MIAASEIEAMLGGNLVEENGACRLETTIVHRVEGCGTGNIETGKWISMTEAIARTANLGVARHLKRRMEE
ncbi:MAG: hypothetical protein C0604_05225 [Clostridiales bacterium]|nr:MAG: hypothetical protein C0604_05225 [Clostridiales bacterium]